MGRVISVGCSGVYQPLPVFLASIIGDKDNQQWRCWLEKVTISARDPWRDFVKNTVIQLHLKGKEESPLSYSYLWIFSCALHICQGAWKAAIQPGREKLFFLGSTGGSMSSNHYYSKIGAAVLKLQFLSVIRNQAAHLRNAHLASCFTSSHVLLSEHPSLCLAFLQCTFPGLLRYLNNVRQSLMQHNIFFTFTFVIFRKNAASNLIGRHTCFHCPHQQFKVFYS